MGVPQDYEEALRWYVAAAEQGDITAQFNLALKYHNGQGVPQSDREAVRWYQAAAEQGNVRAQINLGGMHEMGLGVPPNSVQAHMWFNLAASNLTDGNRETAVRNRDRLAGEMTPEDIAEAERLASEWKPKGPGSQ